MHGEPGRSGAPGSPVPAPFSAPSPRNMQIVTWRCAGNASRTLTRVRGDRFNRLRRPGRSVRRPMRVLVVDQDSAMLESIARLLGDRYTVDAVTTKADCLDLLRQNTFEVIVAGERLEDGSGLELLGQVAKRWPAMLRIF